MQLRRNALALVFLRGDQLAREGLLHGLLALELRHAAHTSAARALDNVFIERPWRSLKYELIYPGDFASGAELYPALDRYFRFYNFRRPHQALGYRMPADLYPRGRRG